jgi:selenium metabolism protein YedF
MQIDARGMTCPKPVVLTLEALPKLGAEEFLEVLVNDEVAVGNLTRLAEEKNCELLVVEKGGYTSMTLVPRTASAPAAPASPEPEAIEVQVVPATGDAVVAVGSDVMGRGSEELGKILVKGLIYALAHQETVPKTMLFFNSGARLTCEGSESLDDIRELEGRGTQILTCGTCLDFYGIRDRLGVGGVTNLYAIAEIIASEPVVTSI